MSECVNKENQRVAFFFKALDRMTASIERLVKSHRLPFGGEHYLTGQRVIRKIEGKPPHHSRLAHGG